MKSHQSALHCSENGCEGEPTHVLVDRHRNVISSVQELDSLYEEKYKEEYCPIVTNDGSTLELTADDICDYVNPKIEPYRYLFPQDEHFLFCLEHAFDNDREKCHICADNCIIEVAGTDLLPIYPAEMLSGNGYCEVHS